MAKRPGAVLRIATPIRAWLNRFAFAALVIAAFAVMLLGKADIALFERVRTAVVDAVAPLLEGMSRPVETVNRVIDDVEELADLRAENDRLRTENEKLFAWQAAGRQLEAENRELRELLKLVPEAPVAYLTARVIGDQGGTFVRAVLVAAGYVDGAAKGQAALAGEGLAGRVVEVGGRASRVLLLTDINSRIPVLVGPMRDRAVLAGDNTAEPDLLYLATDARVQLGDYVVTSGNGGLLPQGLPVGEVIRVDGGLVEVRPYVDWDHMEYLRLVDYGLPGMIAEDPPGEAAPEEEEPASATP